MALWLFCHHKQRRLEKYEAILIVRGAIKSWIIFCELKLKKPNTKGRERTTRGRGGCVTAPGQSILIENPICRVRNRLERIQCQFQVRVRPRV